MDKVAFYKEVIYKEASNKRYIPDRHYKDPVFSAAFEHANSGISPKPSNKDMERAVARLYDAELETINHQAFNDAVRENQLPHEIDKTKTFPLKGGLAGLIAGNAARPFIKGRKGNIIAGGTTLAGLGIGTLYGKLSRGKKITELNKVKGATKFLHDDVLNTMSRKSDGDVHPYSPLDDIYIMNALKKYK